MKLSNSVLIQIGIWTCILTVPILVFNSIPKPEGFYQFIALRVALLALFFNLNYQLLLPIYFSGHKQRFFGLTGLAFAGYVLCSMWLDSTASPTVGAAFAPPNVRIERQQLLQFSIVPAILSGILILGVSASLRGFSAFEKKKEEEEDANRRRLEAELALLKSQINPHFLLNSLNNLYALALTDPPKTPAAILKLSEMVAYILYECDRPQIALERDLHFVKNYIELQQMRLPHNVVLKFELPENPPALHIEPMILISFIENAFKHGLTTKKPCEIYIAIKMEGNRLVLTVENDVFPQKPTQNGTVSGIGLANTRQRLEHAYAGKHILNIENSDEKHRVELMVELKSTNPPTTEPAQP